MHRPAALSLIVVFALLLALFPEPALAQAGPHPFAIAGHEGGGSATGVTGWILSWQDYFYRLITGSLRMAGKERSALWSLYGICFAYGVFHAAGPGHGKAVVASYMLANEQALRRGMIISLAAALLQGIVAVAIVSIASLVLGAAARQMTFAADMIERASYAGIAFFGSWLVWVKGRSLWQDLWQNASSLPAGEAQACCPALTLDSLSPAEEKEHETKSPASILGRFRAYSPAPEQAGHSPDCTHFHAPDPSLLGIGFSWGTALMTVITAGARPCSGAILVLVFALSQGLFMAGIGATFAMSLGTALTTAALAATAVLFKTIAISIVAKSSRTALLIGRVIECLAALAVLGLGVALFFGSSGGLSSAG